MGRNNNISHVDNGAKNFGLVNIPENVDSWEGEFNHYNTQN